VCEPAAEDLLGEVGWRPIVGVDPDASNISPVERTHHDQALRTSSVIVPPDGGQVAGFEPVVREVVGRGGSVEPELCQVDIRGASGLPELPVGLPADSRLASGGGPVDPKDRAPIRVRTDAITSATSTPVVSTHAP
jgi:hypothetical protein